jgi:hypothetical protein
MSNTRRFRWSLSLAALLWASTLLPAEGGQASPPASTGLRVLFIGNSYTYFNNLPELFAKLSSRAPGARHVEVRRVAYPGERLKQHWIRGDALAAIREGHWDYVVLQEQSTLGSRFLDGEGKIDDPATFHEYARRFVTEIRKVAAKPVFFLTWASWRVPDDQMALNYAYFTIGRELQAMVVPVGPAWSIARRERPGVNLYFSDGAHPGPAGSYLAACLFHAFLQGSSPVGLASEVTVQALDQPEGTELAGQTTSISLSPPDAAALQQIAQQEYEEVRAAGGYCRVEKPASVLPVVPKGTPFKPSQIMGTWTGPIRISQLRGTMEITVEREASSWRARAHLMFADRSETFVPVTDFKADGARIAFSITNTSGPIIDQGVFTFDGVFKGGVLAGVTDFTRKEISLAVWRTVLAPTMEGPSSCRAPMAKNVRR